MAKTKLIPGFRFHPTDVELVKYHLKRKVMGKKFSQDVIAEVDIYKYVPWDLPDKSILQSGDLEWYFFCPRGKKYANGARLNRSTEGGFWKTTGRDRHITYNNQIAGMIKTLVFHTGRPPKGDRTDWVIHEYRLEDKDLTDKGIPQDSYVLCRLFQKDGPGPRNGAQYGKPFNEEEWDDDDEEIGFVGSDPLASLAPFPVLPMAHNSSTAANMQLHVSGCIASSSLSCLSGAVPSPHLVSSVPVDDDVLLLLDSFTTDNTPSLNENNETEKVNNHDRQTDANGSPHLDVNDIFKDLGDLDNFAGLGEDEHHTGNQMLPVNNVSSLEFSDPDFLELLDLDSPLFWQAEQNQ
ncbi:hypothetical protein L6164_025014 [Bauhinia variegata]|uniref:Uncharacterized protein n=1 Tax=Bauhinia variegata TaxID=167791 RepID=A0ACB9LZF0_BAUVA|nr:hypothetical protein L6164_025014 [Bauhinia variegata]